MEPGLLDSSLIADQEVVDRGQPHEVIGIGGDNNVGEREQKQSAEREVEGENMPIFVMSASAPNLEECYRVLEENNIHQDRHQGSVGVRSRTEIRFIDLEDNAVVDVDAMDDIEELNVNALGDIKELVVTEPAKVHFVGGIDESVVEEEGQDHSATRLVDATLNVEGDLNKDVIMEGAGQSSPRVAVDDDTRSGQVDAEPTLSRDSLDSQPGEVGSDSVDVSRVEHGGYESGVFIRHLVLFL